MKDFLIEYAITMIVGFVVLTGPVLALVYMPDIPGYEPLAIVARAACWGALTFTAGTIFAAAKRVR